MDTRINLATHRRPFVTVTELADYMGCDRRTIQRMLTNGTLAGKRIGKCWRIPTDVAQAAFCASHVVSAM